VSSFLRRIGPGTALLEESRKGSAAKLLGPLGNGFSLAGLRRDSAGGRRRRDRRRAVPLLSRRSRAGVAADFYLGGRNSEDLSLAARFDGIVPGETVLASDDGSAGERGLVTEVFRRRAQPGSYARLFACGPMPMFAALARIVSDLALPSEFSTEAAMGCGFGACLGCVLPGTEKPFLVSCTEGPILPPERIRW
jgi:dihydroorotate dehydrogenase electron transfer subunit